MHENRLNFLSVMSIKSDVLDSLSFNDTIVDLVEEKSRIVPNL